MKKHVSQMTAVDKEKIKRKVSTIEVPSVKITAYTVERFEQRMADIALIDVARVFLAYEILEYNTTNNDSRVVLRGTNVVQHNNKDSNIIIIYSFQYNTIITGWSNEVDDHHESLDMTMYSRDMKINL